MRLWLMKEAREVEMALKALIQVVVNRADKEREILMAGYTHLQVQIFVTLFSSTIRCADLVV